MKWFTIGLLFPLVLSCGQNKAGNAPLKGEDVQAVQTSPAEGREIPTPDQVLTVEEAEIYKFSHELFLDISENAETGEELEAAEEEADRLTASHFSITPEEVVAIYDKYNMAVIEFLSK
jgi:hypothetical protein